MEKLQFEFAIVAGKDEKSNILAITSISTEEGKNYALPEEWQFVSHHKEILKTNNFSKVKNSLKRRHQTRKVWISMSEELKKIYIDEDGNIQFAEQYLEEIETEQQSGQKDNLNKILEKLVENTQKKEGQQNLKHIAEKFMIEKFTNRNSNAEQWMEIFEKECIRFEIIKDEVKIEILRLFLDKSCLDWHCSTLTKLTINASWIEWKDRFLGTFANKGWNTVTYALSFSYKEGLLIDYAMKKERLLLDMN